MSAIARHAATTALRWSLIVLAFGAVIAWGETTQATLTDADRPAAVGSPIALLQAHADDCWRAGQEAKAEFPGSVIVQLQTGRTVRVAKASVVDAALREVLGEQDAPRLRVIAFCV